MNAPQTEDITEEPVLRHLFSPISINGMRMKNRIMMGSMHLNLDDFPDQYERFADFYALRARHGAGLIVTAGCSPNQEGAASPTGFSLYDDNQIPSHSFITSSVHKEGGLIALQILHFGREAFHGRIVSASDIKIGSSIFTPKPLSGRRVRETIGDFSQCARRAVQAGYDAIELIYSQGFLIHQFLAPETNRRNDEWGGVFENRARLAASVAEAVREAVGKHFPIIFRIPCLDLMDGGISPDESIALIKMLEPFGIDLLNVSVGWHESSAPTIAMMVPKAAFFPVAAHIKQSLPHLKVAVSNRINDARIGERLLMDDAADVISMARPFLADPSFPEKSMRGSFHTINKCIACNQACLDHVFTGRPVGCSVNPECGFSGDAKPRPLPPGVNVAVVGGGISGMASALYLARRGARVTLFESEVELGGQLLMALKIPGKEEYRETINYYAAAIRGAGVKIIMGYEFGKNEADFNGWDHLILAAGSAPRLPLGVPGEELPHVMSYDDILRRDLPVKPPVVIIGGGGIACDAAQFIAARFGELWMESRRYLEPWAVKYGFNAYLSPAARTDGTTRPNITILQRSTKKLAYKVGRTTRWILMKKLGGAGVAIRSGVTVERISKDYVYALDRKTGRRDALPAASVVMAIGQTPRTALAEALDSRHVPYSVAGAALDELSGNANITYVLRSAYDAAMNLGR